MSPRNDEIFATAHNPVKASTISWSFFASCNFCLELCTQKNIRNQVIEGTPHEDTVEQLLKQPGLTLDAAIVICRAPEAAKKQRREMSRSLPGS